MDRVEVIECLDAAIEKANEARDDALEQAEANAWTNVIGSINQIKSQLEADLTPAPDPVVTEQKQNAISDSGLNPDGTSDIAPGMVTTSGAAVTSEDTAQTDTGATVEDDTDGVTDPVDSDSDSSVDSGSSAETVLEPTSE